MKRLLVFLLINALVVHASLGQFQAFKQDSASLAKPQWWAGIDIVAPVLTQLDNYSGWKQAFETEVFVDWRRGAKTLAPRLAASYFYGFNRFDNGFNRLAVLVIKPGLTFHINPGQAGGLYFRSSIPFSLAGSIKTQTQKYDLVYQQNYRYSKATKVNVSGFEIGYGYSFAKGNFLVSPELIFIIGGYNNIDRKNDRESQYVAGVGQTVGFPFTDTGFKLNLYIGRAW